VVESPGLPGHVATQATFYPLKTTTTILFILSILSILYHMDESTNHEELLNPISAPGKSRIEESPTPGRGRLRTRALDAPWRRRTDWR